MGLILGTSQGQRKGSKCTSFPNVGWISCQGWLSDSCFRALGFGVVCIRRSIWANLIMALAGKRIALFTGSCLLIYLRLEILEIHLPVSVICLRLLDILDFWNTWDSSTCVCDLPETSWYTWLLKYLRFIYLCLWFTWDFLIYLTLEILEIHLPVFVIYLRLLDILDSWNTWDSSTCVCDLPETFWYTWDLNYLRFSYLCVSHLPETFWYTWDLNDLRFIFLPVIHFFPNLFIWMRRFKHIWETSHWHENAQIEGYQMIFTLNWWSFFEAMRDNLKEICQKLKRKATRMIDELRSLRRTRISQNSGWCFTCLMLNLY